MEAMILAAGEGTRLRPLTDATPKALVEVGGVPLIERVARRLIAAGAHRLIVNAHHLADQVEAFIRDRDGFGIEVAFSREDAVSETPLDTGGAVALAAPLFESDRPFLLHNADILSEVDLADLYRAHEAADALATLVVAERPTSRPLLIDDEGLYGRANRKEGWEVVARHPAPAATLREVGFAGIHVVSPDVPKRLGHHDTFSIIERYVRWAAAGERIAAYDATGVPWFDVGTPERLEEARRAYRTGERAS